MNTDPRDFYSPGRPNRDGVTGLISHCFWHLRRWCLAFLVAAGLAGAVQADVVLQWDANTETDVTGYRLHYGVASGVYTATIDAGNVTTAAVPDLISNFTYYFAVTASNADGLESLPSNEVVYTVAMPANLTLEYIARSLVPVNTDGSIDFTLLSEGSEANGFSFKVTGSPRSAVAIHTSCDLVDWELLGVVTNPTGGFVATDRDSLRYRCRFYRVTQVEVPPPPPDGD